MTTNDIFATTYREPIEYDDSSLPSEASDVAVTDNNFIDQDPNVAPMHLHALRRPARLTGSYLIRNNLVEKLDLHGNRTPLTGRRSRSTSRPRSSGMLSNNSSRSTSPVTLSSMENTNGSYLDADILTDKLGFVDLDPPLPHEIRCGPYDKTTGGLTPVNERLSEESLEDSHAFNDLGYYKCDTYSTYSGTSMPSVTHSCSLSGFGSNMSVGSQSLHSRDTISVGGVSLQEGSVLGLGRLDEEDDEDDDNLEAAMDEGDKKESD